MNVNTDRRISIEQEVVTKDPVYGSAQPGWTLLATVWAERVETLSNSELLARGLEQSRNPVRYKLRWRSDINSAMRIRDGGEILQIVGGPAEIGRREWLQIYCERSSTENP